MSGPAQICYMLVMYSAIGAAMYWFYKYLVKGPEEEEALRLAKIDARREKKSKKK